MKQQSIGFILCALLLSTFGHEILNRHQEGHSARLAHSRAKTSLLSRHNDGNGRCQVICDQGYYNLTIAVNSSSSVHFAVHNSSSGIVLELDLEARSALVFNRTSKWGILINYESESAVTLDLNKIELEEFPFLIKNNSSLSTLSQHGQKISKEDASKFIQESLILLTAGEYTVSVSESWDLLIHVSRTVSASLKVVLVVVPTEIFTVSRPLNRVFKSIEGLASVVTQTGGVKILIDHQVTISLEVLLSFKSGLGVAGYIWEQLSKKTDLDSVYPTLNTSTEVLVMLADFAQNSTSGVNGYTTLHSKFLLFIDGRESLHILVEVLIEFLVKNKDNLNLVAEAEAETRALSKLIIKLRTKEKLKVVHETLQLILERKLVKGGVDLGAIDKEISDGVNGNSLKVVLRVLNCLQAKTSIQIGVAHLVLHFVELLTVRGGAEVIAKLVGIRVSEEILNAGPNALTEILRGVTISGVWRGHLGKRLRHLPVLGKAIVKIDVQLKALQIHTTVEEALESRSSGGIVRIIIEVIEGALKHIEPVKPIPVITSQSASPSVDIESSTKVIENAESSSKGEDGPVSFPPAPEGESVSSSEGPHNGKIQISGLQGASGSDGSNGHKGTGKHATHGKFYHTHEKRHQQQGKHYTYENQNKA